MDISLKGWYVSMEVHERIKILRRNQHLTQTEFGERVGVSRSVIKNLECGKVSSPSRRAPLIRLIAKEFSVSEEWLLHGDTSVPMYIPAPGTKIFDYLTTGGVIDSEARVICSYIDADREARQVFLSVFETVIQEVSVALGGKKSST